MLLPRIETPTHPAVQFKADVQRQKKMLDQEEYEVGENKGKN